MRGLPQKQNARRADKIRLYGHLRRYKKIVKKTYIIYNKQRLKLKKSHGQCRITIHVLQPDKINAETPEYVLC